MFMTYHHVAVMLPEVIRYLNVRPGKIYVDGTLGGAGHSKAICEKILPTGILIGIDQDFDAIENARLVLKPYASNIRLFHSNFVHLGRILKELDVDAVDGIVLDLGLSFYHIDASTRGFSFQGEESLDMRMDTQSPLTAEDLVNDLSIDQLAALFKNYGEERYARAIAKKIAAARDRNRIKTTKTLAKIVCDTVPRQRQGGKKIHPATRVFMALRIAVNRELDVLTDFMDHVPDYLNEGGRLCVLSYHSLEDRIVKTKIKYYATGCTCPPEFPKCVCGGTPTLKAITRKVLRPSPEEVSLNPMSRSAKLRVAEKLP